ncbi:MAG: hypothetical protein KIT84_18645 [Labilithrix sp.]|nr:hypothetical protein [Labilithrix sp.]MCW5813053.1 hypothetical protein [Labilithrix sp.]
MSDTLGHIEAAIAEVARARSAVQRSKSPQVRGAEERDGLKAVAYAWFKTHKPRVGDLDVSAVDNAYQKVLDATAKAAARSTYVSTLKAAKDALVTLRRLVTAVPVRNSKTTADAPPPFASLTGDVAMQEILTRRWTEVQTCINAGANLAATVMMGGLMETLLLARINVVANKAPIYTAKNAPKDKAGKTLSLNDWKLVAMVEVAHEVGWITKSAKDVGNVLRDFRNYIHPHKEHTDGILIGAEDARVFWEVCGAISRQLLASTGKIP